MYKERKWISNRSGAYGVRDWDVKSDGGIFAHHNIMENSA